VLKFVETLAVLGDYGFGDRANERDALVHLAGVFDEGLKRRPPK
jgi:hypothetical protein